MNTYISGALVRTTATFLNYAGVPTNPTTPVLKYKFGNGSTQTPGTLVNDSPGTYHYDIDTTGWAGPGNLPYIIQWSGTGAVQAIDTDYFEVEPPAL